MSLVWTTFALHLLAAGAVVAGGRHLGRGVLWIAAIPMAITAVWVLVMLPADDVETVGFSWVASLDIAVEFRVDAFGALMALLVSGIGALVCCYSVGYFSRETPGMARFTATLVVFSAAMVGIVWADNLWTLFIFWELTSITSFALVGFKQADPVAGRAARRALMITAGGGLVLLLMSVLFIDGSGSASLADLGPVTGSGAGWATVLLLIAAATKSAQVPFHVWLPGAMAAPTPVSAYLHSATMVKAGIVVVAMFSPALSDNRLWTPVGLTFGLVTMAWGAVGALRHVDAKLILAWGTVSQLGLMMALLALDTPKATFAAVAVVVAHAVFKAALFMVVGEIDVRAGTRDIRLLRGLRTTMPGTFAVAAVSAASMAGVPLVLGFPAKEAAIEAVLGLRGNDAVVAASLVITGSVLTVAYITRFMVGVFGGAVEDPVIGPHRLAMTIPAAVLAAATVLGYVLLGPVSDAIVAAAAVIDPAAGEYELYRWPGFTTAFLVSMAIVIAGSIAGLAASRSTRPAPRTLGADALDNSIDTTIAWSKRLAGRVQHGSLPVYLASMMTVLAAAAVPFLWSVGEADLRGWNSGGELVMAVIVVCLALLATQVSSRLGAALMLGSVGFAVAGLFVTQGAPDLVLTQLLVETVIVVGFVTALGRLTSSFPDVGRAWRHVRIVVSVLLGLAVMAGLAASTAGRTGSPPTARLSEQAVEVGGGNNVVNVILTDIRALDTVGEVTVLIVVAIGILALRSSVRGRERS